MDDEEGDEGGEEAQDEASDTLATETEAETESTGETHPMETEDDLTGPKDQGESMESEVPREDRCGSQSPADSLSYNIPPKHYQSHGDSSALSDIEKMVESPRSHSRNSRIPKDVSATEAIPVYDRPLTSSSPIDYDQPLDLSKKQKSLHGVFPSIKETPQHMERSKKVDDNKPLDLRVDEPFSSHSLFNLEKRFGSKSTILEGLGPKMQPPRNPVYQAFGGNLFTQALYNSPSTTSEQTYRPNRNYWSTSVSSVLQQKPVSVSRTPYTSGISSQANAKHSSQETKLAPASSTKDDATKHTNLICGCRKQFETLYELTVHMQKTGHTPTSGRSPEQGEYPKLVRGQDMWLNQGSEQTRQILRCMQCGESFKTLPELTIHMMKTRHYTNIVGAETKKVHKCSSYCDKCPEEAESVFKCKLCGESLKDMESLTHHMVVSGHHRKRSHVNSHSDSEDEDMMFSRPVSGKSSPEHSPKESPAAKARKVHSSEPLPATPKKSSGNGSHNKKPKHASPRPDAVQSSTSDDNRIRCENCGDKIETPQFVEHVRQCVKTKPKAVDALKAKLKTEEDTEASSNSVPSKEKVDSPKVNRLKEKLDGYKELIAKNSSSADSNLDPSRPESPFMPVLHSTTPDTETSSSSSSALKAMESFIERSFIGGFNKPSFFGSKHNINGSSSFTHSFSKASTRHDNPLPDSTQNLLPHQKYLNPDAGFISEAPKKEHSPANLEIKDVKKEVKIKTDPEEGNDDNEKEVHDTRSVTPKSEKEQDRPDSNHVDSDVESPKPIHRKYLNEEDNEDNKTNNNSSALESLQGLVYGKSFSSEHPLDSLQKLIHNTDGGSNGRPNGSQSVMTGTATFQPGIPSTVILVNPIVTVVPNTSAPPAVQINLPCDSSLNDGGPVSPAGSLKGGGSDKGAASDSDGEPGEYRCQACSRTFASKGSYRYHLSRCHLSTVRKYGFKEAFNMSPYVYLPLDHSAKFNKYYEMANELANKGNKIPTPTPVSPEAVSPKS